MQHRQPVARGTTKAVGRQAELDADIRLGDDAVAQNVPIPHRVARPGHRQRLAFEVGEQPLMQRAAGKGMLARCAKDNYFPMVDVLFRQQPNWVGVSNTKDALLQISKLAGFTQESFEACLTDQKLLDDVRSVQKRGANEFKVDSTPTFFINGKTYKGAMSIEEMSAIIDPLL